MNSTRVKRRTVLRLGVAAAATAGLATGCATLTGERAGKHLASDLELPEPFQVRLPTPRRAEPVSPGRFEVTQRVADVEIIPGTTTRVWGYDGMFPGPTFDVRRGEPITVTIHNDLPAPTSTHLHGGVTPADSDGYPTDLIVPTGLGFQPGLHSHMEVKEWRLHDGSREYEYPLDQPAATLWYHDHRMDFTAPQVWRGLAGMFLIRDDDEDRLDLPRGEYELPLLLCDRAFEADGSFKYPSIDDSLLGEPGVLDEYHQGVEGDVILVNGAPWPQTSVANTLYRLRFVNASNARRFELSMDDLILTQIGSDSGLLPEPQEMATVTIAPAERFDVLVDFSRVPIGSQVVLRNRLGADGTDVVMRFNVDREADSRATVPTRLVEPVTVSPDDEVAARTFRFALTHVDGHEMWTINGRPFDPDASLASPRLDTVERWTFTSDFHHPVHVHMAHFQVLTRNGKPPAPEDAGWKDTVDLRPYEVVEVAIKFSGHRGRYMIHCHNLEHEDMAMMANFDVV